jgi:hypothetical protein
MAPWDVVGVGEGQQPKEAARKEPTEGGTDRTGSSVDERQPEATDSGDEHDVGNQQQPEHQQRAEPAHRRAT